MAAEAASSALRKLLESRALRGSAIAIAAGFVVGTWLCKRPLPRPADPALIEADGGKYVLSKDGKRVVEYFVVGSTRPDARVCLYVAGGVMTGKLISELAGAAALRLNVRLIALSIPGWGYGTIHRRCKYADWPATDVVPILEAEHVGRFVVAGGSLGCPFCMAMAHFFGPQYVLAMGLRVPFLPKALTDEVGLPAYWATVPDEMVSEALPFGWLAHLVMWPLFHPMLVGSLDWLVHGATYWKAKRDYPEEFELMYADMARACAHYGHKAMMINLRPDTILEWGFDPRDIRVSKRVLWYAPDDRDCPPSHGKWLAEHFQATAVSPGDVTVREYGGYGHLGGACFEFDKFLEELMAQCTAAAPRMAMLARG